MSESPVSRKQPDRAVPVRLYEDDNRIMLATPMPGLQAENISVSIDGNRVTVHGEQRGPAQDEPRLLVDEWTPGPYHREVDLPHPVDGALTNATYGNGVLVVTMPKSERGSATRFQLDVTESTRGSHIRHTGSGASMRPDSSMRQV